MEAGGLEGCVVACASGKKADASLELDYWWADPAGGSASLADCCSSADVRYK